MTDCQWNKNTTTDASPVVSTCTASRPHCPLYPAAVTQRPPPKQNAHAEDQEEVTLLSEGDDGCIRIGPNPMVPTELIDFSVLSYLPSGTTTSAAVHHRAAHDENQSPVASHDYEQLSVEAQRTQLREELAQELCVALLPHVRELLTVLLNMAEEENAIAAGSLPIDSCTEAANQVLESHGVRHVRATRVLCGIIVQFASGVSGAQRYRDHTSVEGGSMVEVTHVVAGVKELARTERLRGDHVVGIRLP